MDLYEWKVKNATARKYAHFDEKVSLDKVWNYISNPDNIMKHGFYPFIHYEKKFNKFTKKDGMGYIKEKSRHLCYSAHIDRYIYSYYGYLLNQKYNITEADFLSSEIEVVPAFKARSLGFDGSMVAAYGQDDKICAYTSLSALMTLENIKTTAVCILSDKEEIGSMGNTGMESHMFDYFISELLNKTGENRPNLLDKVFCFSRMLSADVDAGYDPLYASVSDRNNAAFLGRGIGLNKYTGARGKSGASDANAEFVAWIRRVLEKNDIRYQISELGKVDVGGGGTIAYILANKGVDVIDCGVPVLSMHAPYEVTSKFDVYTAYRTYKAFWEE